MSTLTVSARRRSVPAAALARWFSSLSLALAIGGAATVAGALVAGESPLVHPMLAALLAGTLALVALRSPRLAVMATLLYLPYLAFGRRLLALYDGWHGAEPLLLVGPAVAAVLVFHRRFAGLAPAANGRISKLVTVLVALAALQSVNPLGGSPLAGLVGLLFVAAPLLWFFVGRDVPDRGTMRFVLAGAIVSASLIAVYGLAQTLEGMPAWDAAWARDHGYAALNVLGVIRPFGTFSSATEYATYLAIGIVVCVALSLHGRVYALAPLPLLAPALFLVSARGVIVVCAAVIVMLVGLRTRHLVSAVVVVAVMLVGAALGWDRYASELTARGEQSENPLIQHQAGGLGDPLDPETSTLFAHWELFIGGFEEAFRHPLGLGTGATNLGGARFGGVTAPTEVDVTNAFVSLGIPGGVLFLAIVLITLGHAFALYRKRGDVLVFAALAVLLVTLTQWLNGAYYAVAPLVWLLVGWIERMSTDQERTAATTASNSASASSG